MRSSRLFLPLAVTLPFFAQEPAVFLPASECGLCHTRLAAPERSAFAEKDWVGPAALWQGTMMSLAAKDPYWRAKVAFETAAHPALRSAIEDKCTRCHAPAQQYPLRAAGKALALSALDGLGGDGVTCTVCHRIRPDRLGTKASFTANFVIGPQWNLFGPHPEPFTMPMVMHTGYTPVESKHVLEAALCGSCHTVITHPEGRGDAPEFVEQSPYLEWLAGDHSAEGRSCQQCHMPQLADGAGASVEQYIAHRPPGGPFPPTRPRSPFAMHEFAGGNTLMPILVNGSGGARVAGRARRMLARSMELNFAARREKQSLIVEVDITNTTGHKLPTGYPSRRMWIHLTVTGGPGRLLFESGAWDPSTGRLIAGEKSQPHHTAISGAEQVQIFEATMAGRNGEETVSLMSAARFSKDNRILPRGYKPERLAASGLAEWTIAPAGVEQGPLFAPGRVRTKYVVPLPPGAGPLKVWVETLYQSIKPSHLPPGLRIPAELLAPARVRSAEMTLD
jgi:hypothetical protein